MAARKNLKRPDLMKYQEDYVRQVHQLCKLGATNKQTADFFEVNPSTINQWMKTYPVFEQAVRSGKMYADAQVAYALYLTAIGYPHQETKMFIHRGEIVKVEYVKHYPPNVKACKYWLINRQPGKWRHKQALEVRGDGMSINVKLTSDAISKALQRAYDQRTSDAKHHHSPA